MAVTETKFGVSWIVSAVFILLSVSTKAEQQTEGHRCYWCGPLAEQVHRSQRASTCSGDKSKVTICDEDLPYCAIVATSPPYVESRFCVKFYQDECYSLFCNSTKTWKMTCTCRGELCNGNNTQRETEAFEVLRKQNLAKLTQNKRPKRAFISKGEFIGLSNRRNKIDNATEENKDVHNETVNANIVTEDEAKQNTNPTEIVDTKDSQFTYSQAVDSTETTTERSTETAKGEATTNESVTTEKVAVENESSESASVEASVESDETKDTNEMDKPADNTEKPENVVNTITNMENKEVQLSGSSIQIDIPSPDIDTDDLKTDIIIMSSEIPKLVDDTKTNDMVTKSADDVPKEQTSAPENKPATDEIKLTPVTTTEMIKITTEAIMDKPKKTSEKLPTAEALQHNDTPTTKTTEQMLSSTTTMTLNTHIEVATQATIPRNNTAVRVDAHILTLVIGVILHY